jgi:vacuolar-type H+-ATPase subunit E/Vma4
LLSSAQRRANEVLTGARARAQQLIDEARDEAGRLSSAAQTEGMAVGEQIASKVIIRAHQQARELVLQAKQRGYDELRKAVVAELDRAPDSLDTNALVARLAVLVRERLYEEVSVESDRPRGIWAKAQTSQGTVQLTTEQLAKWALNRHAEELESLWR